MPKMRLGWYAGVSTALAGSVVVSAFYQRPNFYSAMVYLAQSNFCLISLVNFTLLVYSGFLFSLTRLCFGQLRAVEVEQLTERAWIAITETCLAMTIFREEIGAWFLIMFTLLVSGKIWGWIGDGRVEILEQQPPANPRLFHIRLSVSLLLSCLYDATLLSYTINTVIQQARPNMMVMFLFEFAVLTTCSWRTGVRYLLSIAEQRIIKTQTHIRLAERRQEVREQRTRMERERATAAAAGEEAPADQEPLPSEDDIDEMDIEVPGWASKGEWVLWLDLITDMVKLGIYVAFFFMLMIFYGLPIHIMRDLFMTSRDFLKRLNALLRYRRAIKEMNKYPDATPEELAQENTCIICREEMRPWDPVNNPGAVDRVRPKKLPCGHTLHLGCLKSWLERQQVCPTCRSPVTTDRPAAAAAAGDNRAAAALRFQIGGRLPDAAAQPVANQAHGAAPNQQPRQGQQQVPQPENNNGGPRVFNVGRFRLAFARGNQLHELAQRFGMPPEAVANRAAAAPAGPAPNQSPPSSGDRLQDAASLLLQAQRALQQEIQSLHHRQAELQTSQLLLAELHRLRQGQQQDQHPQGVNHFGPMAMAMPPPPPLVTQSPVGGFVPPAAPFPHLPGMPLAGGVPPRMNSPILGRHGTSGFTTSIPSGSADLPDGVSIPPGWSLMPLHRYDGAHPPRQPSPQPGPARSTEPVTQAAPTTSTEVNVRSDTDSVPVETLRSGPSVAPQQPSEPTPVVSPSPVIPNWGGPSQLFANSGRPADTASQAESHEEPGDRPPKPQSSSGESEEDSSEEEEDSGSGEEEAPSREDKGKARAVTVEEASDDSSDGAL